MRLFAKKLEDSKWRTELKNTNFEDSITIIEAKDKRGEIRMPKYTSK